MGPESTRASGAPVRLVGADPDVIAVAREAAGVVWSRRELRRDLFRQLASLHRARRELIAPRPTVSVRRDDAPGQSSLLWRATWGALLTIGLASTMATLAMLGPYGRKNRGIGPDEAMQVAMPALYIAVAAVLVVLLVRVPRGEAARIGTTTTVVVSIFLAVILGFRAMVGGTDRRPFTSAQLGPWLTGAGLLLLLLIVLAWRLDRQRRRDSALPGLRPRSDRTRREDARWLQKRAAQLAALAPESAAEREELSREWSARLDRLAEREVDGDTLAQARTLTPVAWLAWVSFDGDIDISGIRPPR